MNYIYKITFVAFSLTLFTGCSSGVFSDAVARFGAIVSTMQTTYAGSEEMRVGDTATILGVLTIQPDPEADRIPLPVDPATAESDEDSLGAMQMRFEFHGTADCSGTPIQIVDGEMLVGVTRANSDAETYLIASLNPVIARLPYCSELTDGLFMKTAFEPNENMDITQVTDMADCRPVNLI